MHQPGDAPVAPVILHGNDYLFTLARTREQAHGGWPITGRQTWIRWRSGDERHYDVDSRMRD